MNVRYRADSSQASRAPKAATLRYSPKKFTACTLLTTMINSQPDITSESDIQLLVDGFYAKVVEDALLGPVFNGFAHVDWPRHLPVMYDFWSSLLLGTTRYHGRPFPKHLLLPIGAAHFQRWLALFEATVNERFAGHKAEEAKARARGIAILFEHRLHERNPFALM